MPDIYLVDMLLKEGVSRDEVEDVLEIALDWYRYKRTTWIVVTDLGAAALNEQLLPFAQPDGQLFICRLDVSERKGWMNREFWRWLRNTTRSLKEKRA